MTANVSMITENGSQSKLDNYKNIILENNAIITIDFANKSKDWVSIIGTDPYFNLVIEIIF